jgi:hypothetical protein
MVPQPVLGMACCVFHGLGRDYATPVVMVSDVHAP